MRCFLFHNSILSRWTACMVLVLIAHAVLPMRTIRAQGGEESSIVTSVNNLRASKGLNTLTWNNALAMAALDQANFISSRPWNGQPHVGSGGSLPQSRAGAYGYTGRASENVVLGSSATADWAMNWWMNSSSHYANMVANWNEIGVSAVAGSYGRAYVVVFGLNGAVPFAQVASGNTSGNVTTGGSSAGSSGQAAAPKPTRVPPTQGPTATPTITLTPSNTFTPLPSFTPSITPTGILPTETAIVIDVVLPGDLNKPSPTVIPTDTPIPTETIALPTESPVAIAAVSSPLPTLQVVAQNYTAADKPDAGTNSGNLLRTLLPVLIGVQALVFGGMAVRAVMKRRA